MTWQRLLALIHPAYVWVKNLIPQRAKTKDEFLELLRKKGSTHVSALIIQRFYAAGENSKYGTTLFAGVYKARGIDGSRIRFTERYGHINTRVDEVIESEYYMKRVRFSILTRLEQLSRDISGLTWTMNTWIGPLTQQDIEQIRYDAQRLALDLLFND